MLARIFNNLESLICRTLLSGFVLLLCVLIGREVLRMHVRQRSLALFTDPARGADGIDDVGFSHGVNSSPLFDSCGECRLTFA